MERNKNAKSTHVPRSRPSASIPTRRELKRGAAYLRSKVTEASDDYYPRDHDFEISNIYIRYAYVVGLLLLQTIQNNQLWISLLKMLSFITFSLIALFWLATQPAQGEGLPVGKNEVDWASVASSRGDRFPDFSYCGYHNSEISLPTINNRDITLALPRRPWDNMTPAIQEAINTLAQDGGGVVKLPSGRLSITAGIQLHSNVVVTGSGGSGTTLVLKKQPSKPVFTLGRLNIAKAEFGFRSKITNTYVPIGSSTVTVINGTGFAVGQPVYVSRATTESWVRYNGMSDLVRDGVPQTWIPVRSFTPSSRKWVKLK